MNKKQDGLIEVMAMAIAMGLLFAMLFVRFSAVNERVSGVVYNTTNNSFIGGNTHFSVRASEATYTTEANQSTYCLPGGSPYIELVNRAAEDKRVKIVVITEKYFAIQAPWVCKDNIKVTEVK